MSSERKLISAILQNSDITTPLEIGISESIFFDVESKKAFSWIFRFYSKFRVVPTKERFKRQFPDLRLLKVNQETEPFLDICEEVMQNVRYKHVVESVRKIAQLVDEDDPSVYDEFIRAGMQMAGIASTGDMVKVRDMGKRIDKYEDLVVRGISPMGLRFGLPTLDKRTMGMKDGDFVNIAARLGTGKSNLLKHIAMTNFLDRKNVLTFSLEESKELFERRFDSMLGGLNYDDLKTLSMSKSEIARWRENAKRFAEDYDNEHIVISGLRRMGPDTILSYVERIKPDIVLIDGVHLLRMGNTYSVDWQKITQVMDEIKQMALYTNIPFCGVVQSNRASAKEGVNSENISFADAIGQLSDIVVGVFQDVKMLERGVASVRLAKNRDGIKGEDIICKWNLGGRIEIRELTEKEVKTLGLFEDEE